MTIRPLYSYDDDAIAAIHEKFYKDEFSLPDFRKHFINVFVIVDDNEQIITVAGVRPILEIVALTDKDHPVKERVKALNSVLTCMGFVANYDEFDELHVFAQNPDWVKQLKKRGFQQTKGNSLVFKIG